MLLDKNKKTVITYGTFDMFHIGHLRLIQRMQQFGDQIIVAVSTDSFNALKGKKCVIPFEHRAEIIRNIKGVDLVIEENSWAQKIDDIKNYNVQTLIMGDDWTGEFDDLKELCNVEYLPRTEGVSTTEIKRILSFIEPKLKDNLNELFKLIEEIQNTLA